MIVLTELFKKKTILPAKKIISVISAVVLVCNKKRGERSSFNRRNFLESEHYLNWVKKKM